MQQLIDTILQFGSLTNQQIELIASNTEIKTLKTGEYFSEAGKTANQVGFILQGIFRVCYYNKDGDEITRYFIDENNFLVDLNSFSYQIPSSEYIQAVTDVEITYDFSEEIKDSKVTINAVHPGVVKTNLGVETSKGLLFAFVKFMEKFVAITPEKSAERIVYLATADELSTVSGKYFKAAKKPASTNSFSYKLENRKKLMMLTEQLIQRI